MEKKEIEYRWLAGMRLTEQHARDVNELMRQLTGRESDLSVSAIEQIQLFFKTQTMVAVSEDRIVGMATIVLIVTLSGRSARIEDVVVAQDFRGRGIGKRLMTKIIEHAPELLIRHLDLTSAPHRESANELYKSLGFKLRETNVYRLVLEQNRFPSEDDPRFATKPTLPEIPKLKASDPSSSRPRPPGTLHDLERVEQSLDLYGENGGASK